MAVLPTAIWRVRPGGTNTNGGGYDPGIAGAATDYSTQDPAQATGTNGAGSGTTTFTDATANLFTAAMVGNAIQIAGQGTYFVITFSSASAVVVDRALGTFSGASWSLGGGWANPWTNATSAGPIVPGNTVYILGSATPNPAAYVYDYTFAGSGTGTIFVVGDATNGKVVFANDPATPGYKAWPDTTGGMPTIKTDQEFFKFGGGSFTAWQGLWFVMSANGGAATNRLFNGPSASYELMGCVLDHLGFPITWATGAITAIGCEAFSSTGTGAVNGNAYTFELGSTIAKAIGCNIHDTKISGALLASSAHILACIVAKNAGKGVEINGGAGNIIGNTIDGNLLIGILIDTQANFANSRIFNNIISNQTVAAQAGIRIAAGTAAQNTRVAGFCDYNVYYNNIADFINLNYGPHDTHGGANPYTAQATENYKLVAGVTTAMAFPGIAAPQHLTGQTNTVQNFAFPGGVQPAGTSSGGGISRSRVQGG